MAFEGLKLEDFIKEATSMINELPPLDRPPTIKAIILGVESKLTEETQEFQELANTRIEANARLPKVQ
jgi:hypothetical protein